MTYSYFQNAKFTGSYPTSKDMPAEEASEIAFCGRSNCGKSSVLNALTNNKKLAKCDIDNEKDAQQANSMGIKDLDKKYELSEIVKGDSIFCATGITDSSFIKGVTFDQDKYISETLITHKNTNFKQLVKNVNSINE